MSKVTGVVSKVYEKATKKGPAYSLAIDTGKGDDEWFSAGFKRPAVEEGQRVRFGTTSREWNGKTYYNVDGDIEILAAAQAARSAGGGGAPASDRQESIIVQSSLKSAIELVGLGLANGALSVGAGNAAKKHATLMGMVEETTRDLAQWALNPKDFLANGEDEVEEDEDWEPLD